MAAEAIFGGGSDRGGARLHASVLIVPAMNYSLLLTRSIDFDQFAQMLYPAYPDELNPNRCCCR